MRIRLHIAFVLVAFSALSCEKTEFESCTNYDQLAGEWESINSDTKNSMQFYSNGKVIHKYGLERDLKFKSISCVYEKSSNSENYKFRIRSKDGLRTYEINSLFDTIIRVARAQDILKDTVLIDKMKFVKIK